jgi:trimeric autotransporter adhesin
VKWRAGAALTFSLLLATLAPAHADKVGVAAAVNPDAFSSLSGSPQTQLNIGKSIFFSERINTTGSGLVQVLLVDGSTFTVGPGSDLVIDKFVYDPNKKSGEIVASFTKGAMRFVGGKISKNEGGVVVNTPSGALAIRGGMFQGSVNGGKGIFSFLYGVNLTLTGKNGQQYTVFQPNTTIDTTSGTPTIRPTTTGDVNALMHALTKGGTVVTLGGSGDKTGTGAPKQVVYETLSLQDLISDATQTSINDQVQNQEDKGTTTTTDTTTTPTGTPTPPTDTTTPPNTVTARVLLSPGVYTAFRGTLDEYTTDGGDQSNGVKQGILGGGNYPEGTPPPLADDFVWTFGFANGRLVGTVSGLTDAHCTDGNCNNIGTTNPPPAAVNFPSTFNAADCVNGVCAITDATITQGGKTTTYQGLAVLKTDFFAYQLIGVPDASFSQALGQEVPVVDNNGPSKDPLLVFGGKKYDFGTPSGRTFAFELTPDVKEVMNGAIAPFSGEGSAPLVNPNGPQPSISPLLYKETDNSNALSRGVWLQTSFYINTTPADPKSETSFDQQSFVNVALGGVDPNSGGLVGARRGGSSADVVDFDCNSNDCGTHRDQIAFTGDIATLAGPDGSHFLGKDNPNIVIGFDSTGTHNIGRDIPLDTNAPGTSAQDQSGSTYHVGVGDGTLPPQQQTYDGEFKGYAAGIYTQPDGQAGLNGTNKPVGVLTSGSPNDFSINFNPQQNTLSASLTVAEADPDGDPGGPEEHQGSVTLGFGDSADTQGRSAFIDNLHYAAIETPGTTQVSVLENGEDESDPLPASPASSTSYLVSGDQLGVTQFFPNTFQETSQGSGVRPFCTNCDFLKWGAWGTRTNFADPNAGNATSTMNVHLGWWAAASLTSTNDIESLVTQHMTADYSGHALGNVASEIGPDQWKTYVAAGDLEMHWDFACRNGELTISNFDNHSFTTGAHGLTQVPGINQFSGAFTGLPNGIGGATGSFADNIVNNQVVKAGGVLGNFYVNENTYKASGIFAGSGIPHGRD